MATYTISSASAIPITMTGSQTTEITSSGSIITPANNAITVQTNSNNSYILNNGTIQANNNISINFLNATAFGTLTNNNTIASTSGDNILLDNSIVNQIINNNSGSINGNIGISLFNSSNLLILENYGVISCNSAIVINGSTISSYLTNNNNIISNNSFGIEIQNGSINILNNSGTIQSSTNYGLYLTPAPNASQINILNNFGSIINNDESVASILCGSGSTIVTFNNLQNKLTYEGNLPTNYNIVINSILNYGSLEKFNSISGTLKFGIYPSSVLNSGIYFDVFNGLANSNIDPSTRTGIFNTYYNWNLVLRDNNEEIGIWDLVVNALNPACVEQIGGPQPPRLWSRDIGDCVIPTAQVTQYDLDMRRKAEILKYKANSAQLTKKQQWSQNVRGAGPNGKRVWANQNVYGSNPNTQKLTRIGNTLQLPCVNNNGITCSPSNASDVPGPNITLCYNPNIPLVNYKVQRTYLAGGTKWPQLGGGPKPV